MADDSSKLKAQIEFLTNLIKSHKQTAPQGSGTGSHVSSVNNNVNNNGRSFSWQRSKQLEKEKKQPVSGPPHNQVEGQPAVVKSSYSLDRRKISGNSSGSNTTMTSLKVPAIPGPSGLSLTTEVTKSISNVNKAVLKQNNSKLVASKPTVSSKATLLHGLPQAVSPPKSVNMTHHSSSSQPSLRNPYVLNKKETLSVSGGKTVAQKSELKWSKPSTSSISSSEDSKSHSDSELYTKKSNLPSTRQLSSLVFTKGKSSAMIHPKVASMSNVQGSFKWSKTEPTGSSSLGQKKSVTKKSKLKWTKPGVRVQVGSKRQLNPYVLRKENMANRNAGHKQGMAFSKTTSKSKVIKRPLYSAQNQNSHVWRSRSTLKLDRRNKVQSNVESVSKKALSRRSSAGFIERRQRAVLRDIPVVTRYSVVRSKRKQAPIKAQKLNKVVVIGGVPYKTSSNKLTKAKISSTDKESGRGITNLSNRKFGKLTKTVNIQGEKFVMDSKGKTLQRVNKAPRHMNEPSSSKHSQMSSGRRRSSNGHVVILRTPTTLVRSKVSSNPSKTLASRVLRRSIHNARLYKKSKKKPASQQYCMFYNRFGKCNKQDTCPYIHDPSKVAVCTKFLRGRCKNVDGSCPFSHKIDRDKMPVCQFFLRGKCSNDNCPYSHVNVSKKAEVCEDFLKGFCSRGQQCNKKHILECEEFSRTGKCSKGSKCKLMHRARKPAAARKRTSSSEEDKESLKHSKLDFTSDEGFLPLAAITLDSEQTSAQDPLANTAEETKEMTVEPVVIRPRFLKPKEPEKSSTTED